MNKMAGWFGASWRLTLIVMFGMGKNPALGAPPTHAPTASEPFDYAQPQLLNGTLYSIGSNRRQTLFTFHRSATRSGATVSVVRQFDRPDGATGAIEKIVYESGQLVSYELKDPQAGLWGLIQIFPDPEHPGRKKVFIDHGRVDEPKGKGSTFDLPDDTEIDDTLYPFAMMHWPDLARGKSVKFHFVSLEREKTYGFKLTKSGESILDGKSVLWLKMEPTSFFVAQFINPIFLAIEKDAPHHVLEYTGRTTPRIKKDGSWKYLDAETVLNWP